jgi:hypothetical protein
MTGLMLAGAGLLAGSAGIHLRLWSEGYRNIATIGPLFLLQAVTGFALAALVAFTRRPVVALAGAAFLASTIGGLVLSAWLGLFGFHESYDAPFAHSSLVVEGAGILVLGAAAAVHWRANLSSRMA